MSIEINKDFLEQLEEDILAGRKGNYQELIGDSHPADIAEIVDKLEEEAAEILFRSLENELGAEVLMEIHEDLRSKFLEAYNGREIASELIEFSLFQILLQFLNYLLPKV